MKLDKKQLPSLILLGVLVLICIGYVSFTLTRPKSAPPPPAATDTAKAAEDTASDEKLNSTMVTVLPARRDPFMVQDLPGQVIDDQTQGYSRPVSSPVRRSVPNVGIDTIDRATGNIPPINPFTCAPQPGANVQMAAPSLPSSASSAGSAPAMGAPEPTPDFVLTGVIRGDQNVAIIRVGEKGRYVVKQGQLIDGRYRVLSVTDDGAVLAHGSRRINVKLGGA